MYLGIINSEQQILIKAKC